MAGVIFFLFRIVTNYDPTRVRDVGVTLFRFTFRKRSIWTQIFFSLFVSIENARLALQRILR